MGLAIIIRKRLFRFTWILLFFIQIHPVTAEGLPGLFTSPEEVQEYYHLLASLSSEPPENANQKIKNYLEEHGDFERAYIYLLEHLLYNGKLPEAKAYFRNLANRPEYRRNSSWMLARIYTIEDSSRQAFRAYQDALNTEKPSVFLLNDFCKFLQQYQNEYDASSVIENLAIHPHLKTFARTLWYWENFEFYRIIETTKQLPDEYANNEFMLNLLAYSYQKTSQDSLANLYFQRGLELTRKHGDRQFESFYLSCIGIMAAEKGDPKASQYHEEALAIAQKLDGLTIMEFAEVGMGLYHFRQKNYSAALEKYTYAEQIATRLGMYDRKALDHINKAEVLLELGRLNDTIKELEEGEKSARKANALGALFSVWLEKAEFYRIINLHSFAEYELRQAYELAESIKLPAAKYRATSGLADLLIATEKYSEARKLYSEALALPGNIAAPDFKIYWKFMIGESHYLEKKYDSAAAEFTETFIYASHAPLSYYTEYLQAFARLRIANIEAKRGNFEKALNIYSEKIINEVAERDKSVKIELNHNIGKTFQKMGDLNKAIERYRETVKLIEAEREDLSVEQLRIGYFSGAVEVYNSLIHAYWERYFRDGDREDLEKIFYYLEMSRARSLKDLRVTNEALLNRVKDDPKYLEYQQACAELQFIQREIRTNPLVHDSLYSKLETARYLVLLSRLRLFEMERQSNNFPEISLETISQTLRRWEAGLLFYHISKEVSFVFAADDQNIDAIKLNIDPVSLSAAIDTLLTPFHNASSDSADHIPFHAATAHRLYNVLLKPVENKFSLQRHLIVVPDLALSGLPLGMLLSEPPEKPVYFPADAADYAEKFILQRYSLLYAPSIQLSPADSALSDGEMKILVVANPMDKKSQLSASASTAAATDDEGQFYSRSNWRYGMLWYADSEGESIKAVHPSTDILKREEATLDTLKRSVENYQILHFATHAFVDTVFDAFSGLMLALDEESTEDGLLMGYEIADMSLDYDLITLSACETGIGKAVAGEGVLGLPRLFMRAGARRVLMTLWKVGDQFSLALMPKFYDKFLNGGKREADALREAKLSILGEQNGNKGVNYQHPFFWAAFSLYGEPDFPPETNYYPFILFVVLIAAVMLISYFIISRKRNKAAG
jgi:CHAT domain-containing protein/Tfp pilus assembly protein PilF